MELSIQKSSRFLLHFLSQQTSQTSLFLIASLKTILLFHFSPKPTAEGETKRQQSKQLQFHKITRKKRTYVALLLSDANRTFLPTSLNSSPGANCQICLLFTERLIPIPKTRKRLKCIHSQINSSKHIKIN